MAEEYDEELQKQWERSGIIKGAIAGALYGIVAVYAFVYDFGDAQRLETTPLWKILILYVAVTVLCAHLFAQLGRILFPTLVISAYKSRQNERSFAAIE